VPVQGAAADASLLRDNLQRDVGTQPGEHRSRRGQQSVAVALRVGPQAFLSGSGNWHQSRGTDESDNVSGTTLTSGQRVHIFDFEADAMSG